MIDINKNDVPTSLDSLDEIVFNQRNKRYGAYPLRKNQNKDFLIAMVVSICFVSLLSVSPSIYSFFKNLFGNEDTLEVRKETIVEAEILDMPLDPEEPPPPPVELPPPPKVEMIRFLPPEIKPDNEIKKEEIPPTVDELEEKKNIGATDQEGDTNLVMIENPGNGIIDDSEDDQVYVSVQEPAEFIGGPPAMNIFLNKNLTYPKKSLHMEIEGRVMVYFEIDKEGSVSNVKVLKGINEELDSEAIRVVKSMPKWKPAKNNGRNVKVKMTIPIRFALPE